MTAWLEVAGLVKRFPRPGGLLRQRSVTALDGVSFVVPEGGGLGIVGESGCGKSTLARATLRLIEPDAGTIHLAGEDFRALAGRRLRRRRRQAQLVFQDAGAALDARMRVGNQVAEPLIVHRQARRGATGARVAALLERVGLSPVLAGRFPHQLSGGQRQRLAIARALATSPRLLLLDEPMSSLDVSVKARVLALLATLREEGLAMVLISHDLSVMGPLVERLAVMYFGRVVEIGDRARVLRRPRHPYTAALLAAVPSAEPGRDRAPTPRGEVPSLIAPPSGCPFHPRCPRASARCRSERPELDDLPDHAVACHHPHA